MSEEKMMMAMMHGLGMGVGGNLSLSSPGAGFRGDGADYGGGDLDSLLPGKIKKLEAKNKAYSLKTARMAHAMKTGRVRDQQKKRQKLLGSRINQGRGTILTDQLGAQGRAPGAKKGLLGL